LAVMHQGVQLRGVLSLLLGSGAPIYFLSLSL
jgi:hypothetical protein